MIEFLTHNKELISIFSNITTILAFFIAVYVFFRWKKEQKFSKQLEYIMELEDSFEILMRDIKIDYKWSQDLDYNLSYLDNGNKEEKKQLNNFILNEYEKYKTTQTIEQSFYKYSLSIVRVKRFFKNIDTECEIIDYNNLKKLNTKGNSLSPKWTDKENISEKATEYLRELTEIHENGLSCIQKKY